MSDAAKISQDIKELIVGETTVSDAAVERLMESRGYLERKAAAKKTVESVMQQIVDDALSEKPPGTIKVTLLV